jgi:tyrosyl-tRNA synthetase
LHRAPSTAEVAKKKKEKTITQRTLAEEAVKSAHEEALETTEKASAQPAFVATRL